MHFGSAGSVIRMVPCGACRNYRLPSHAFSHYCPPLRLSAAGPLHRVAIHFSPPFVNAMAAVKRKNPLFTQLALINTAKHGDKADATA